MNENADKKKDAEKRGYASASIYGGYFQRYVQRTLHRRSFFLYRPQKIEVNNKGDRKRGKKIEK